MVVCLVVLLFGFVRSRSRSSTGRILWFRLCGRQCRLFRNKARKEGSKQARSDVSLLLKKGWRDTGTKKKGETMIRVVSGRCGGDSLALRYK